MNYFVNRNVIHRLFGLPETLTLGDYEKYKAARDAGRVTLRATEDNCGWLHIGLADPLLRQAYFDATGEPYLFVQEDYRQDHILAYADLETVDNLRSGWDVEFAVPVEAWEVLSGRLLD